MVYMALAVFNPSGVTQIEITDGITSDSLHDDLFDLINMLGKTPASKLAFVQAMDVILGDCDFSRRLFGNSEDGYMTHKVIPPGAALPLASQRFPGSYFANGKILTEEVFVSLIFGGFGKASFKGRFSRHSQAQADANFNQDVTDSYNAAIALPAAQLVIQWAANYKAAVLAGTPLPAQPPLPGVALNTPNDRIAAVRARLAWWMQCRQADAASVAHPAGPPPLPATPILYRWRTVPIMMIPPYQPNVAAIDAAAANAKQVAARAAARATAEATNRTTLMQERCKMAYFEIPANWREMFDNLLSDELITRNNGMKDIYFICDATGDFVRYVSASTFHPANTRFHFMIGAATHADPASPFHAMTTNMRMPMHSPNCHKYSHTYSDVSVIPECDITNMLKATLTPSYDPPGWPNPSVSVSIHFPGRVPDMYGPNARRATSKAAVKPLVTAAAGPLEKLIRCQPKRTGDNSQARLVKWLFNHYREQCASKRYGNLNNAGPATPVDVNGCLGWAAGGTPPLADLTAPNIHNTFFVTGDYLAFIVAVTNRLSAILVVRSTFVLIFRSNSK